jgi:hypothetical protein
MKDDSESLKVTDYLLHNDLAFLFYLLPSKLNVHGKEFLDAFIICPWNAFFYK